MNIVHFIVPDAQKERARTLAQHRSPFSKRILGCLLGKKIPGLWETSRVLTDRQWQYFRPNDLLTRPCLVERNRLSRANGVVIFSRSLSFLLPEKAFAKFEQIGTLDFRMIKPRQVRMILRELIRAKNTGILDPVEKWTDKSTDYVGAAFGYIDLFAYVQRHVSDPLEKSGKDRDFVAGSIFMTPVEDPEFPSLPPESVSVGA